MSDITSSLQPDWGEIDRGNSRAIADALYFLYAKLNEETKQRFLSDLQHAPTSEQDWMQLALTLRGPLTEGLVSMHRVVARLIRISLSSDQTILSGATTKIQFGNEVIDYYNEWDGSVNFRFTPKSEGKWFITSQVYTDSSKRTYVLLYKNGSAIRVAAQSGINDNAPVISDIVEANGSTDYFEIFVTHASAGGITAEGRDDLSWFTAVHLGI